ncbi:MAG: ATP-binding cassette domain-containing protein [Dehalococcoidia bacterium]|nr:ATP-binding cassette domain-containing protein [Dehalococcoidia bacterium]
MGRPRHGTARQQPPDPAARTLHRPTAAGVAAPGATTLTLVAVEGKPGAAGETGPPALAARGLRHLFREDRGIRDLTLEVPAGSIYGLLGANGSGKSTLLNLLAGLLQPQAGELLILGSEPGRAVAGRCGWVFQEHTLDPLLTARETLSLSASLYRPRGHRPLDEAAAVVGLADRLDDRVGTLSGGMKRRLELARAILHRPDLLIMDEPTLGLDVDSRTAFWRHIAGLNETGLTVLIATNDVREAEEYCTLVAFLREGACAAAGTPRELRRDLRPESLHLRWPGLSPADFSSLSTLDGVSSAARSGDLIRLTTADARSLLPPILTLKSGQLGSIEISESSLEDAYFSLTGGLLN